MMKNSLESDAKVRAKKQKCLRDGKKLANISQLVTLLSSIIRHTNVHVTLISYCFKAYLPPKALTFDLYSL